MSARVSIIVPTRNVAHQMLGLLASIAQHADRGHIELIVVDGGSTDGTIELLQRHRESIDHLLLGVDRSLYEAMNKGVAVATGDWLLFMGADDRLLPSATAAFALCHTAQEVDCIVGNVIYETGYHVRSHIGWSNLFTNRLHHQAALYHRSCFDTFRYDPSYAICADYELNLLLVLRRKTIKKIEADICRCGAHGFSVLSQPLGRKDLTAIRRKYLRPPWREMVEGVTWVGHRLRDWRQQSAKPTGGARVPQ